MKSTHSLFAKTMDWLIKERRHILFIYCVFFIFILQWDALDCKISEVDTVLYTYCATDLEVTPEYRYGFASSLDGTILVKTPASTSSTPLKHISDGKLQDIMQKVIMKEILKFRK